jgi:hypothetical protein
MKVDLRKILTKLASEAPGRLIQIGNLRIASSQIAGYRKVEDAEHSVQIFTHQASFGLMPTMGSIYCLLGTIEAVDVAIAQLDHYLKPQQTTRKT